MIPVAVVIELAEFMLKNGPELYKLGSKALAEGRNLTPDEEKQVFGVMGSHDAVVNAMLNA